MSVTDHVDIRQFMDGVARRNPGQPEFVQAVQEVAEDVYDYIEDKEEYHEYQILRRIAEPDRVVSFRVCWEDDRGNIRFQRGWRVQNNNAIGPYKGGIRFHRDVTESVLKFLAFEQTFKNSLTGLPMGGGKGGANFNPKGKSDHKGVPVTKLQKMSVAGTPIVRPPTDFRLQGSKRKLSSPATDAK